MYDNESVLTPNPNWWMLSTVEGCGKSEMQKKLASVLQSPTQDFEGVGQMVLC